jgi:hypothetical protein
MSTKVLERGAANTKAASAYSNTVADYESSASGDNIIESVPCDSTVFIGAVVRMNSGTAVNAIADSSTNSKVVGICVAKTSSTVCNIQVCGATSGIFGGLTDNNYFLSESTAGQITTTAPTGSGEIVIHIGRSLTSSRLVIQVGTQIRRAT